LPRLAFGAMARVFSGIQPSGALHLGNYLGALRRWLPYQEHDDARFCIVDLHALTLDVEPAELRAQTLDTALAYLAAGLDPSRSCLFVQSHVPEHTELSWLLECTASYGELLRMTQFKDKAHGRVSVRASLLTYPALMAADILAYDTEKVPVGDDQRQHLELTRTLAARFNARFGTTFVVPEADIAPVAARIMDLQQPSKKMSKSTGTIAGTIFLTDDPATIARKVRRAVTDTGTEVAYDPEHKPGVSNLLEILAACLDEPASPAELAGRYHSYGALKADVADALIGLLSPFQARLAELRSSMDEVRKILATGASQAREEAARTLARAREAIGLLARS
jgi:tryptophanyl-tRNA synthetase